MSANPPRRTGTVADWLAADEDEGLELIDGELVPKASSSLDHGSAQSGTGSAVRGPFHRRSGGPGGPGGWWIASEVDILLEGQGYRSDLAGWRRDRAPEMPRRRPVTLVPDWICEILSDSNREHDTITKLRGYHQAGVPHYWIIDQLDRTLTVHRHHRDGYVIALRAAAHERVRAEPFDAIELHVAVLLGDDPDDSPPRRPDSPPPGHTTMPSQRPIHFCGVNGGTGRGSRIGVPSFQKLRNVPVLPVA